MSLLSKIGSLRARRSNKTAVPFEKAFTDILKPVEVQKLLRIGLRPKEISEVPIDKLFLQFRSEWPIQGYSDDPKSRVPMPITGSPLLELLESYKRHGKRVLSGNLFLESSYYKLWKAVDKVGFRYDWYNYPDTVVKSFPDDIILRKMNGLINVYESIRRHGYRKGKFKRSTITALNEPFENTRFGFEHDLDGYEIWSGHHRAAALAALGIKNVEIIVLEDEQRPRQ